MSTWSNGPAPQDGTPIVAIGRLIWKDGACMGAEPFTAIVRWSRADSGYEGWHVVRSGLSLVASLDEEVLIDWWSPEPVTPEPVMPAMVEENQQACLKSRFSTNAAGEPTLTCFVALNQVQALELEKWYAKCEAALKKRRWKGWNAGESALRTICVQIDAYSRRAFNRKEGA